MSAAAQHVRVQTGSGLVARFGPAVVVLATTDPDDGPFVPALLAALDQWSGEAGSSADFAWKVADLMSAHRLAAPAFGAAVPLDDGYLLVLHGAVRAMVTSADVTAELSGRSAATWVDQVVPGPVSRLAITLTETGEVTVDQRSDLRGGLVGGDGLVLTASGVAQPAGPAKVAPSPPRAAPTAAAPKPAARALGSAPDPANPVQMANVTQPGPGRSDLSPPQPQPPVEVGNGGRQSWPVAEETAFVEVTDRVLVADDGTRILLDRQYVFGRDPFHDRAVISGAASPIVVRDPDQLISRVQVHVSVVRGVVTLLDGGSANGTFVAAPGAKEWVRLGDQPAVLPPGWSMRIGRRVYTYVATAVAS